MDITIYFFKNLVRELIQSSFYLPKMFCGDNRWRIWGWCKCFAVIFFGILSVLRVFITGDYFGGQVPWVIVFFSGFLFWWYDPFVLFFVLFDTHTSLFIIRLYVYLCWSCFQPRTSPFGVVCGWEVLNVNLSTWEVFCLLWLVASDE